MPATMEWTTLLLLTARQSLTDMQVLVATSSTTFALSLLDPGRPVTTLKRRPLVVDFAQTQALSVLQLSIEVGQYDP